MSSIMMVGGSVLSRFYYSTLSGCVLFVLILSDVTMAQTSSSATFSSLWKSENRRTTTSAVMTTTTVSDIQCVRLCWHMGSCNSAAFDSAANTCFFQPTHQAFLGGDAGPPVNVFTRASKCNVLEAPELPNAHLSNWRMTSSSLEGDVTCDADYMSPMDEPSLVACQLETGMWTTHMPSPCQQVVWRNNKVKTGYDEYPLPRTPQPGWAVCLSATPTNNTRFAVDLVATEGEIPFHVSARLNENDAVTVLNYKVNGFWAAEMYLYDSVTPFPFRVGDEFNMTIRAPSSDKFNVYVQGAFYGSRTVSMSVSDVTKIAFVRDVQVHYLNVWC